LEHIADDRTAMREVYRLLQSGGVALLTVPVNASRRETSENPAITTPAARYAHFTAEDHVRYYGLDFAERPRETGSAVETVRMTPDEEVRHGLLRDAWRYVASQKPLPSPPGGVDPPEHRG
jgi:ubiquinone/menaquinone biosynthesis C-methylase UbiE